MIAMSKAFILKPFVIGVIILFFLVVIKAFNIAFPVRVTTATAQDLAVVGEGKVEVVPDSANVEAGITVTNAATVEAAQSEINEVNNAIIAEMQKLGIDKKYIKTANYSIYPNYDFETGRRITGYAADVRVTITTKQIDQVSQIVSAATAAGANTISGTSFTVSDPAKYREAARNAAIENAKHQANAIAKSLGIKLGPVVNIVEASPSNPDFPIVNQKMAFGAGGAAESAVPDFQAGTQEISSVVTLYFEKR